MTTTTAAMKKFLIYLDDGDDCLRVPVPAQNKEEALQYVRGNGEVIAVKDITDDCQISSNEVVFALKEAGFDLTRMMLIVRALELTEICNPLY